MLQLQEYHSRQQTIVGRNGNLIGKVLCPVYQTESILIYVQFLFKACPHLLHRSHFFQMQCLMLLLEDPCHYHLMFNHQFTNLHPICCRGQMLTVAKKFQHILCFHLVSFLEWSGRCRLEVGCHTLP